jgi:hypothetical protein
MPTPIPLDEDAVRRVLARAVELERERGSSLTEIQVREIAQELAIPAAAIDQALAEHRDAVGSRVAPPTTRSRWRSRVVVAAIVGMTVVGLVLAFAVARLVAPAP